MGLEVGAGGTPVFGGMLGEDEWNTDLTGTAGMLTLEKMVTTDPTVHSALMAMTLPITATTWHIEPASDDPTDVEIAQFVEKMLFSIKGGWGHFIDEALDFLIYGHYDFEMVWQRDGDQIRLAKLAPRPPTTITAFYSDDVGDFQGIKQQVNNDTGAGDVFIPNTKLLHIARRVRSSNFRGRSVFRAAWKPYFIKRELEVIAAIGYEKRSMGVDVGTLEQDGMNKITEDRRKSAEKALMGLAAREKQFLVEVPGFSYRLEGLSGSTLDPTDFIQYLDISILRSVLTEFVAMGPQGGSLAEHRDKTSFFTAALKGHTDVLIQAVNSQVIQQIVAWNFPGLELEDGLPKLTHDRLDTRNIQELSGAISTLVQTGVLAPTRDVENAMRSILELPEREMPVDTPDISPDSEEGAPIEASHECDFAHKDRKPTRPLRPIEKFVDIEGIHASLDNTEDEIVDSVMGAMAAQAEAMVDWAREKWDDDDVEALLDPPIPDVTKIGEGIGEKLLGLVERGSDDVTNELKGQGMPEKFAVKALNPSSAAQVEAFLTQRGVAISRVMASKLRSSYTYALLPMIRDGALDTATVLQRLEQLSDKEIRKGAQMSTAEAISIGRQGTQAQLEADGLIGRYEYSSLGDESTCDPCFAAEAEGSNIKPGSSEYTDWYPPLQNGPAGGCEGSGNCRCEMIAVLAEQG